MTKPIGRAKLSLKALKKLLLTWTEISPGFECFGKSKFILISEIEAKIIINFTANGCDRRETAWYLLE
jgi:hypothetical protein